MSSTFRTWAEIDLDAIRHNLHVVRQTTKTGILAVVKANAYGHGAPEVAAAIADKVDSEKMSSS
jgi:alanine racemase